MSAQPEIRALLFDIGQVILRVDPGRTTALLAQRAGLAPEEIFRRIKSDPRMADFQEGRLAPEQWHQHLCAEFGVTLSFEEFCEGWNRTLEPEPILDQRLFRQLTPRYRLVLLSNTDPIHVAHMERCHEFLRYFAARVLSYEVGVSKPAAAIYRRSIAATGVEPERILFVDDDARNVEGGRLAGLQAYQFRGAQALRAELHARGIL